jgi:hypothetical protein
MSEDTPHEHEHSFVFIRGVASMLLVIPGLVVLPIYTPLPWVYGVVIVIGVVAGLCKPASEEITASGRWWSYGIMTGVAISAVALTLTLDIYIQHLTNRIINGQLSMVQYLLSIGLGFISYIIPMMRSVFRQ